MTRSFLSALLLVLSSLMICRAQDPVAAFDRANRAYEAGKYPEAIALFRQALEASPQTGNIHLYIARAYHFMGDKSAERREEVAFRTWQREALEADARAQRHQIQQPSQSMHSSQKP